MLFQRVDKKLYNF